jgi:pilus assembly protein CpaB
MKGRVVPIVIAIVLALAAGGIVYFLAQGADQRAISDEQPVDILVATSLIAKGTALQDAVAQNLVQTTQVPIKLQPAGSIQAVTAENGPLLASADIPAGQVLISSAFVATVPINTALTPLEVPDGLVAVSVPLQEPNKVGSFLRPGSMVAIMQTTTEPAKDPAAPPVQVTRVLIDRIQVLAIGPTTAADAAAAPPEAWASPLVTLAADQVQAEKLLQAMQLPQQPYLVLLSENSTLTPTAGVSAANLFE